MQIAVVHPVDQGPRRTSFAQSAPMTLALATLLVTALLGSTAHAEVITGRFQFLDGGLVYRPIRRATVEVIRLDRGGINWSLVATLTTDNNGSIPRTTVTFRQGSKYSVRVYAQNPAATVWKRDAHWEKFYGNAGERNSVAPGATLNFDYNDPHLFDANHFNIADAILYGFDYATARRASMESDAIDPISVFPILGGNTFFDPIANALRLQDGYAMDDHTILHEYGHYLEDKLSGFHEQASDHNGCTAWTSPGSGISVAGHGFAWMEGFASYFAQAVAMWAGPIINSDPAQSSTGTFPASMLENPAATCTSTSTPLHSIELFVAGALWDIIDPFSGSEANDRLCMTPENPIDRKVFQVFDRLNLGWSNPTLQNFVDGWIAAGFDLPSLISAFGSTAAGLVLPPFYRRYDSSPAANFAYWQPSTGVWSIAGGENGATQQWGQSGDVPLPRDYDGDGFTDLLVYRPSEGNWYLISSRTQRTQVTQWGMTFDVPAPGDYDGDSEVDYAVYRPGSNEFIVHVDGCRRPAHRTTYRFSSLPIGTPLVADVNRDGREDPILYLPQTKTFVVHSGLDDSVLTVMPMDTGGVPFVGNFDGMGNLDFATFSGGYWHVKDHTGAVFMNVTFGRMFDTPVPADYNGDGKMEIAVYTSTFKWLVHPLRRFEIQTVWGEPGAIPVPAP